MLKVKFNLPKIYAVGDVKLIPGINYVPDDKVEAFLDHPHVKIRIEKGTIEVLGGTDEGGADFTAEKELPEGAVMTDDDTDPVRTEAPTAPISAAQLVKDIPNLFDMALLRELATDSRKTVQKAAQDQIERIEKETEVKKDSGSDGNIG